MSLIDDLIKGTQIEKEQTVIKAKKYLADTDWVISKIDEYRILGLNTSDLIVKYNDILNKRKIARNSINDYENN